MSKYIVSVNGMYYEGGDNLENARRIALKYLSTHAHILRKEKGFPRIIENKWGEPIKWPINQRVLPNPPKDPFFKYAKTVERIVNDPIVKNYVVEKLNGTRDRFILNRNGSVKEISYPAYKKW